MNDIPAKGSDKLLSKLERKFSEAKNARAHKPGRWRRNEELYTGKILAPFNLPKYKSRIEVPTPFSIVETIYAILTDRKPVVDLMPKREDQVPRLQGIREALSHELEVSKAWRAVNGMKRDGLIYGNGFLKLHYDNELKVTNPDVFSVFFDPLCTSIQNARCVIFATPTYVEDIRADFGKEVKSEGKLDEFRSFIHQSKTDTDMSQVTTSPGHSGNSTGIRTDYVEKSPIEMTDSSEYGGGQVLLKEAWYFEGDKLYIATWAGDQVLQHQEADYPWIPIVTFKNYGDEHSIWGKGEPEIIEPLAVGTAIAMSQAVDNLILHGNPAWVLPKSMSKTHGNRPTDKPGQIFWTTGPHEKIDRLVPGDMSRSTLPLVEEMLKLQDTVSGVHDITQGRRPTGVTASRAIQQLQEASQQIIRVKEREVGTDSIIDMHRMALHILKNHYVEPITVRKVEDDEYKFDTYQPYDLDDDLDFKYVPGSTMPESKASRIDQAMDYLKLGVLTPEQFWRWHEKDISSDILEELIQQKRQMNQQMQSDMETIQSSTNEDEILNAKLRLRESMGYGEDFGNA